MSDSKTILGNNDNAQDGIVDNSVVDNSNSSDGAAAAAAAAGTEFDYSSMISKDGSLAENWRDGLPEDIRSESCLDNIKHVSALAKSFVSAQKMVGANKVAIPGEHATEEELNTFYKALGRPDSADNYSVDGIEIPDGIQLDDAQVKAFREFAFKNGLNQKTFAAAIEYDIQRTAQAIAESSGQSNAEYDETLAKLQAAWGRDYEKNLAQCNAALDKWGLEEVFDKAGLLNNYQVITAMSEIGASISESRLKGGNFNTPADPQAQINAIMGDTNHPFYKKDHPGHDAAVKLVNDLLAQQQRIENAAAKK